MDIPFQADLVNLIRVKGRTLGTKTAKGIYHLLVEEEAMIVAAVTRNQTQGSLGTLNLTEKFLSSKETLCKSKMTIGKGWWPNR